MYRDTVTLHQMPHAAACLLQQYPHCTVWALHGSLGAGKTTLVVAVIEHLGLSGQHVHSPTFSLANLYTGSDGRRVAHLDLYRLRHLDEAFDLGIEDYLDGTAADRALVEWPQLLYPVLSAYPTLYVYLEHHPQAHSRIITAHTEPLDLSS